MSYTVEFENEGNGAAYGVYVKDQLDLALDDSALTVHDIKAIDFSTGGATTPGNFTWSYDKNTRTLTVMAGDIDSLKGGSFTLDAHLRADAAPGTVIANQAVVYFPNSLEVTPTNSVVSAVPLPTQLAYTGATSVVDLDTAALAAKLSAGTATPALQPVGFDLAGSSLTAITDSFGVASTSLLVSTAAGGYNVQMSYPGDGFYYLPSAASGHVAITPRATALQAPFASVRATDTARIAVTLLDDRGQSLVRQAEEPKSVYLELVGDNGSLSPLASSLLSGTSAYFQFAVPQPLKLSWPIRARFAGDSHYAGVVTSGTLRLIDDTPPVITIRSPSGGQTFAGNSTVSVNFSVRDDADLAPSATGYLIALNGTQVVTVGSSATLVASSLQFGDWEMIVQATDWAGNTSSATTGVFHVVPDVLPPRTSLLAGAPSYGTNPIFVSSQTPLSLYSVDDLVTIGDGRGLGVAQSLYSVDGGSFTVYTGPFTLPSEGLHHVSFYSTDVAGNVELTQSSQVVVDVTPPVSGLAISGPMAALSTTTLLVGPRTVIAFSAVDPVSKGYASGVGATLYSLNGSTFTVFSATAPVLLASTDTVQTLSYYSQDNVLNTEVVKSTAIVLDSTAPVAALTSPCAAGGLCDVVMGTFPVLGSVFDLHLQSYVLDFAPGKNAPSGFVTIGSGTVAVSSGVLAVWDTTKLSGWQTLRLTATDLVLNQTVALVNVFVGDPAQLLILGNDDVFNMPQGVAVGPGGAICVADTNASRVAVFSSTGTLLASFGRPARDGDDLSLSTSAVVLNHPEGVFVDPGGHIFVADTNNNRVLELSTTGQLLLTLGRQGKTREKDGDDHSAAGKSLGQFNKPAGVAVDAAGQIYVADTLNNRVQVFSSTGAPLLAFSLPAAPPEGRDERDRDADDAKDKSLGRPYGIAVDAAGRIYVADPRGSRALEFSAAGQLLLTIPIAGGKADGVAVTPDGSAIFVADRKLGQVFGFDALGQQTLVFGRKGAPGSTQAITLRKPVGLALDAAGDLFIADRNGDRIKEVSLPNGQATLVTPPPSRHEDEASDVLDRDSGGAVARDDKAGIRVPPGALSDDLKIVVSSSAPAAAGEENAKLKDMADKGMVPAYAPVQYYPEGTQFQKPVTITLPYDPKLVAQLGIAEDGLHVNYWDPGKRKWQTFDSVVDKDNHTVSAKTTHFSLYQVLSGSGTAQGLTPQATASNTVDTVQIACNPLRPDCQPIRFQNLPAYARLRVYTITGALVRDLTTDGLGQASWDGANQSGAPAASGVYFVFAQGNGTKKTFKIAVEK